MCIQQEVGVLPLSSTSEGPGFTEVGRTKPKSEGSEARTPFSLLWRGSLRVLGSVGVNCRNVGFW